MQTIRIFTILTSLLVWSYSSAQEITVTVAEAQPVTIKSNLDFSTSLDESSLEELKELGIKVDINGTQYSPQGTVYTCKLRSVSQEQYDAFSDAWKIRLAMAEVHSTEVDMQDEFVAKLYASLLTRAESKARPMAMALNRKLDKVTNVELIDYRTEANPNSANPYTQNFVATLEVDYSCKR